MSRACLIALLGGMFVLAGGLSGQDTKKDDPKAVKKDDKKDDTTKLKGRLPQHWGKIGLTDTQKQQIYKIQGKYGDEIDKLEAKIKDLKSTQEKEMRAVLTPEQKKALEAAVLKEK